ncbi:glycosyl hydrolase [Cohnella caldifontis]|uniref:glycosyl hydrolase n=1 Tax=Cohnella caldifontis TaxID=3027471 RepID=UPI0023ECB073|nr:glycosyl hydrolase [Cohnella sp. YIM B05605]
MRKFWPLLVMATAICALPFWRSPAVSAAAPVNPDASLEARTLLNYLDEISGTNMLSGQHDYSGNQTRYFNAVNDLTDQSPAVWSTDLGFGVVGHNDTMYNRDAMVEEAISKWNQGSLVALTWHMCAPTVSSPCDWDPGVQGASLTDQQWQDITTPGTSLYDSFISRIDEAVPYLTELKNAHVPVLWRPFHEMDGSWFWWGGNPVYSKKLYQIMYDRYVNTMNLDNLIWVWNVNYQYAGSPAYADFFPGSGYVDVLTADVYFNSYSTSQYDDLLDLADGKPIALAEVGELPSPAVLAAQPMWTYAVVWAQFLTGNNSAEDVRDFYGNPRILNQNETQIGTFKTGDSTTVDDAWTGTGLHYFKYSGNWNNLAGTGKYKGSEHESAETDAATEIEFRGTQVSLYGSKAPNRGIAAVSIDGGPETDVDYYAGVPADNTLIWSSAQMNDGLHTLRIRVKGTKHSSSGGYSVTADRIVVASDNEAPTAPSNLLSSSTTDTSVNLSWNSSTDNRGVTGYRIYRGAKFIGETNGSTSYTATALDPSITYDFKVRAIDARGHLSAASNVLSVTTNEPSAGWISEAENAALTGVSTNDSKPEFSGTGYVDAGSFDGSGDRIEFTVQVPSSGPYILKVRYAAGENKTQIVSVNGGTESFVVFPGTDNYFESLNVGDVSLNAGNNTITIGKFYGWMDVDRIQLEPDTRAPSGLNSPSVTESAVELAWTAPSDTSSVAGYRIYRGTKLIGSTSGALTSYMVSGLDPSVPYSFTVRAFDQANEETASSNTLIATTLPPSLGALYEAENADLTGVSVANSKPEASGTGYVEAGSFDENGDCISFDVTVPITGTYRLKIRYAAVEEKTQIVNINSGTDVYQVFPETDGFETLDFGEIPLTAGNNQIKIGKFYGWMDVDRIWVSP